MPKRQEVRAFRRCVEYGLNNDWQYFITITLDDKKLIVIIMIM